MVDNTWVFGIETRVFSRVKAETEETLKTKYPNIFYTTSGVNKGTPNFPTVYIHELPSAEIGSDLVGKTINAVMETLQVEVITNTNQLDAKTVMSHIVASLKGMSFDVSAMPSFNNETANFRLICRCRRVLGYGEEL